MSVFGRFKKGRQAAKEHKASLVEKQQAEEQKPAYRHVPTHAAVDALAGAPSSWRDDDRARIVEENRRRSAMTASGMGHETPIYNLWQNPVHTGMTRTSSSLSHVSYPSVHANPVVSLPRAHSYSGSIHLPWGDRNGEVIYSGRTNDYFNPGGNLPAAYAGKGKAVERVMAGGSSRGSRIHGKAPSVVGSSSDSTSSGELEMKSTRSHPVAHESQTVANNHSSLSPSTGEAGLIVGQPQKPEPPQQTHRLHPSKGRKPTDSSAAAIRDRYYPPRAGQSYRPTVHRPGSSPGQTFQNIPPIPSLPPKSLATPPTSHSATIFSSGRPSSTYSGTAYAGSGRPSVRTGDYGESPNTPITETISVSASPATPHTTTSKASEFDFEFSATCISLGSESTPKSIALSLTATRQTEADASTTTISDWQLERAMTDCPSYKTPHMSRFDFEQDMPSSKSVYDRGKDSTRSSLTPRTLPVQFNEASLFRLPLEVPVPKPQPPPSAPPKVAKGKLTKTPQVSKPPKATRRWSFSKSGST